MPDPNKRYTKEKHPRDPSNRVNVKKEMHPRDPSMKSQKGTGSSSSMVRMQNLANKFNDPVPEWVGKSPFPKTGHGSPRMKNLEKTYMKSKSKKKKTVSSSLPFMNPLGLLGKIFE